MHTDRIRLNGSNRIIKRPYLISDGIPVVIDNLSCLGLPEITMETHKLFRYFESSSRRNTLYHSVIEVRSNISKLQGPSSLTSIASVLMSFE
jgi:hypothetical protein